LKPLSAIKVERLNADVQAIVGLKNVIDLRNAPVAK
jgi:hypothetical protein